MANGLRVRLRKEQFDRLSVMKQQLGAESHVEVVRQAIAFYDHCLKQQLAGAQLGMFKGGRFVPLKIKRN